MKHLTIDFELYESELNGQYNRGINKGISLVKTVIRLAKEGKTIEEIQDISNLSCEEIAPILKLLGVSHE